MTPQPTAEAAQSAPSVIPSGEIERAAYMAGFHVLAFSIYPGFGVALLLSGVISVLRWLAGKLRCIR